MTYGVLYEFERTSTNGADIRITIRQKWYEGEVKKRALGRAPVIKRDNNGHIYGTSCEIYAECLVDGEFSQLYTSDAFEFRVDVYRNEILIWQGFVSPELYSEPDIAPPYDVQIIATDGLGELKNYNFEKRGVASILSHIDYLMSKSGVGMAFNVVSGLRYINSQGVLSAEKDILNININLDHEEGNSCYDVLQNILSSLNANITQHNGRYLIFRETDFINKASDDTVEAFDVNGTRVDLPIASFGSIQSHQWWPIGQLSTVIEPAKNEVILKSPDFYKNNGLSDWNLNAGALYDDKENAYSLPSKSSSISQTLDFGVELGYRLGLRVRARNVGAGKWGIGESSEEQNLGVKVEMHGRAKADYLGNQFWLVKSEGIASGHMFSDYVWSTNDAAIGCEMSLPSAEQTAADAQNIDIVIPLFDDGTHTYGSYAYADQLKITIFNPDGIHKIYVYDVSLVKYEQTGGYEADVIINNAAREGASDIDLAMTAGDRAPEAGAFFMTGLPLQPATKNAITQWQTGNDTQDYLSAMAYDYSRAIALPKMKYSGSLNVPGSATVLPTLFFRDGTYYFPKTYSYDLYNDEMSVELISISAADVSLAAVIISQYAQPSETMGASTTGTASPGGTAISFPRDTEMSETSDNAVENKVIKKYVDDLRDQLLDLWNLDENGNLVTDKQVLIKNNLIVSDDTSSGGSGSDTPALGTVTSIKVNNTPYNPNSAGVIDLSEAFNSIDVSDQLENYALKDTVNTQFALVNSALSGKQDAITSSNKLAYSLISGTPTIPTKTSQISEDTNLYFTNARAVSAVMGSSAVGSTSAYPYWTGSSWATKTLGARAFDDTAYLPLSGGTITGVLTINPSNGSGGFYVYNADDTYRLTHIWDGNTARLYNIKKDGSSYGILNLQGTIQIGGNTAIHSGNYATEIGDYYLKSTGGILRDSWSGATEIRRVDNNNGNVMLSFSRQDGTIVGGLGFSGINNPVFVTQAGGNNTLIHSGNIGSQSVASAYKLITSAGADVLTHNNFNIFPIGGIVMNPNAEGMTIGYNSISWHNSSNAWTKDILYVNSSGNVTIGASDLAGTNNKLWVNGSARVAGDFNLNPAQGVFFIFGVNTSRGAIQAMHDGVAWLPIALNPNGGNVLIGTTTDRGYKLDVNGEVRATTFRFYDDYRSRITLNGSYIDIISAGNEMCIGTNSGDETMYINYRNSTGAGTAKEYWWNAGSSTSWANHYIGGICCSSAYPISLFAVGSGSYNRTVVEYSSSGLIIERARKTDSYSGEIIPLIISQRGGGVAAKFDGNDLYVSGNLVVSGDVASA